MATRMTLCGFCRRLTCERTETGPANRRQETVQCESSPLLPDHILIEDTYCRDCERFYQQLVTFGRGDVGVTPDPPARERSQSVLATGPST